MHLFVNNQVPTHGNKCMVLFSQISSTRFFGTIVMNYILDELDPLERVQEAAPRKYKENCTLAMTKIDTVE